jgi:hypothetical protein
MVRTIGACAHKTIYKIRTISFFLLLCEKSIAVGAFFFSFPGVLKYGDVNQVVANPQT